MHERLGEILLARNALPAADQLHQALQSQFASGVRIGTALVQLEAVQLDEIGRCLGAQHSLPVATAEMIQEDNEILGLMPSDFCAKHGVFPLRFADDGSVLVAMQEPSHEIAGEVLFVVQRPIQRLVVPELRLAYWLERYLEIPRDPRFLRTPAAVREGDERRRYLEPIQVEAVGEVEDLDLVLLDDDEADAQTTAGDEEFDLPIDVAMEEAEETIGPTDLLVTRLAEAKDRDAAARILIEPIHVGTVVTMLLWVRDDVAVGWWGHGIDTARIARLVAPLEVASAMHMASSTGRVVLARGDQAPIVSAMAETLRAPAPGDVCVAPVVLADRVVSLLVVWSKEGRSFPKGVLEDLSRLVHAAGDAFTRLSQGT